MKYLVVIEWAETNYSAYVPDLPGCVSVGDTVEETKRNIGAAMRLHLRSMAEDGDAIPPPTSVGVEVDVPVFADPLVAPDAAMMDTATSANG